MDPDAPPVEPSPPVFNYVLSFLLVGIAWGFTTPFIRRAAVNYHPPTDTSINDPSRSWLSRKIRLGFFTVIGLLRSPSYAVPLLLNLTGSVWFFILVGQAGTNIAQKLHAFSPDFWLNELLYCLTMPKHNLPTLVSHCLSTLFSAVYFLLLSLKNLALTLDAFSRAFTYDSYYKFIGISIYCFGGVVRRRENHISRHLARDGSGANGNWSVCRFQVLSVFSYLIILEIHSSVGFPY